MELTNRIEIVGNIGNVRNDAVPQGGPIRFSLANNYAYVGKNNEAKVETLWINVAAFPGKGREIDKIAKGQSVRVVGRLRMSKYSGNDGVEKTMYEIVASKLETVDFYSE